ncbi:MAG TPA: TIGR02186 family protein [Nitratidesulfovibrio sp.]|nr:TIGR02186 family protein [Nitratidesulfovibrio sp.]
MRRTHPLHIISGLLLCLCLLTATARADDGGVALAVKPGDIVIGTSYTGATLHFSGEAPRGSAIVARFTGASGDLALRQKGKAFSLLWMNMGTVHLHNVPTVYLVASSRPLADIGGTGLGLDAVRAGVKQEGGATAENADALDVPAELVRLKQQDGLYREGVGGITVTDDGAFSAELAIPSRMSPGTYTVDVFALRDGQVVGSTSVPVRAELVGAPAWLAHMAFDRGLLYGVLATLVAILAGLAVGLVFQSKGAH